MTAWPVILVIFVLCLAISYLADTCNRLRKKLETARECVSSRAAVIQTRDQIIKAQERTIAHLRMRANRGS